MADNTQKALEAKNLGNAAFSAKKYEEAVQHFTNAIQFDPNNHILYSNRSACYNSLNKFEEALNDAQKTTQLKSDWSKGFLREGNAFFGLGRYNEALESCNKGLKLEPTNEQLKSLLEEIKEEMSPKKSLFGPEAMAKLTLDPRTRAFMSQPDFLQMIKEVESNPQAGAKYMMDPRMQTALSVIFGFDLSAAAGGDDKDMPEPTPTPTPAPKPQAQPQYQPPKPKEEPVAKKAAPVVVELTEAQKAREEGNKCYKSKDFDGAIKNYERAYELDNTDILALNNKAAVLLELQRVDECIELCQKALERAAELRSDYKIKSKVLTRLGNAYTKKDRLEDALKAYNSAIVEDKNADTIANLNRCEKQIKEKKEREYLNPELSLAAKNQGNDLFRKGEYPEAIKQFEEAIKRNPTDHTIYSNRSACYAKLGEYPLALRDAEKTIEMAPTFVKGFIRKANAEFAMGEFQKVLETCDKGLRIEENNKELEDLTQRTIFALNKKQQNMTDEERLQEAAKNPEILEILQDPIMNQILKDMQNNPAAVQDHLKNPIIRTKFEKLVKAGVIKLGR